MCEPHPQLRPLARGLSGTPAISGGVGREPPEPVRDCRRPAKDVTCLRTRCSGCRHPEGLMTASARDTAYHSVIVFAVNSMPRGEKKAAGAIGITPSFFLLHT